ncbi:putative uncharacterized protein DDB_G0268364, partial [Contarinia nasturtii]|uniref:putative uncharacterized protein DDB_G0268364 n=1 Tax=Contarinia nasturtii TaxID=265458 RepID=UPI0012D4BAFF
MKMRYKVNFHALLYFLSICSPMMGNQAPNTHLNSNDRKINSGTDTSNTFLINLNNNNHSNENKAGSQRTTFLASTLEKIANISTGLTSNNETNRVKHTKIQTKNGNSSVAIFKTTEALEVKVTENHQLKSMSSIKEALLLASPWPPPPVNQLNNKYFVNQVQSNLSSSQQNSNQVTEAESTIPYAVETSTITTSQAVAAVNKYFVSNASLLSIENVTHNSFSTVSSSKTLSKTTLNPLSILNKNKTVQQQQQHHHHQQHGKTNGSTSTGRTHFQIAQKQLTLSKNIRTEPPPMLNHILDSLSVSHLHHDHRFVHMKVKRFRKCFVYILNGTHIIDKVFSAFWTDTTYFSMSLYT